MIIVCKDCISGCEELNSAIGLLTKNESFECFHCKKVIEPKIQAPDEPLHIVNELILPKDFVDDLEVNHCQNCATFESGTELHEYVRRVLASQNFEKYYPTLSKLFDEDYESFAIPEIGCRGCDNPDTYYWLNDVGDSIQPISRFSAKRKSRKLSILEDAWLDGGEPQIVVKLDSKTNTFVPDVQKPPIFCGMYSELETKENMAFFQNDSEYPKSLCFEEPVRVLICLEKCKSVEGKYVDSDGQILTYSLKPGFIGIFLWIERDKIIRKSDDEKIAFFQEFINHYLACREHVYHSEIGIPKFRLDERLILFRKSHLYPWHALAYNPPKIDYEQIFDACEAPEDVIAALAERKSYISISWQLLIDAIAQFQEGRYRECIINTCSSIETLATPRVRHWIIEQTFSGAKDLRKSYKITKKSLDDLKAVGFPDCVINKLEKLKNKNFTSEGEFLEEIKHTIGEEELSISKSLILTHTDLENDDFRGTVKSTIIAMSNPIRFEIYFNLIARTSLAKFFKPEEQKEILEKLKTMNKRRNDIVHDGESVSANEAVESIYAVGKVLRAIHLYENEKSHEQMIGVL